MGVLPSLRGERGDQFVYRPLRADGNPVTSSVPLEGRDELKQSREIKLAARSRPYVARRESGAVRALTREIVCVGIP